MPRLDEQNNANTHLIDHLANLLDGISEKDQLIAELPEQEAQELEELLAAASWISQAPKIEPSDEYRQQSRVRIMEQINPPQAVTFLGRVRLIYTEALRSMRIRQRTALVLMSIVMLIAMLSVGGTQVVLASSDALPGDNLYEVKIMIEEARLLVSSPEKRVVQIDENLQTRLEEIEQLIEQGRFEDLQVALNQFDTNVNDLAQAMANLPPQSPERSAAQQLLLETAHLNRIRVLTSLLDKVPENARQAIEKSIHTLDYISTQEPNQKPEKSVTPKPTKDKTTGKPEDTGNSVTGKPTKTSKPENKPDPQVTITPTQTANSKNIPPGQVDKDKDKDKPDKDDKDKDKDK